MKFYKLILLSSIFLLTLPAYADIERGTMSSIATEDGTTRVYPYEIKVPNTALSDNSDGTASISTSVGDAPSTADYLVGTTQSGLSAEIVVGTTPGGSLGGTWGSPTVDDDSHAHTGSTLSSIDISADTNLTGTANQIILTDDTLSTPQDIHTSATPQFARLGLGVAADATSLLTLAAAGKIEFKGGASYTGTLAWGPLGTRAITFPDDSGVLALLDASGGNTWTTKQMFTSVPDGTTFTGGSIYINPASATAGYTLFGVGVGDVEKFKVDAEGDVTLNSIIIGANTLTTSEWANLDGVDQTLATTSTPQFARLGLGVAADASDQLAFGAGAVVTNAGALSFLLNTDISSGDLYTFSGDSGAQLTASSGVQGWFSINADINQSGTAGYKVLYVNVTETATGSGSKRILDFSWGGTSKFIVSADATGGIAQCTGAASYMQAAEMRAAGDVGGAAGTLSLTSTIATVSTGVGTVLMNGTTARNSARWGKLYSGTTALYFPLWSTIN